MSIKRVCKCTESCIGKFESIHEVHYKITLERFVNNITAIMILAFDNLNDEYECVSFDSPQIIGEFVGNLLDHQRELMLCAKEQGFI